MVNNKAGQDRSSKANRGSRYLNAYSGGGLASIGVEIVASIAGLGLVGWGIDWLVGTDPWGLVLGLVLGVLGGMYNAVKKAYRLTGTTFDGSGDDDQQSG